MPRVMFWLGYDNPFCEFVKAGWGLGLLGVLSGLLATHGREDGRPGRRDVLRGACTAATAFALLLILALIPLARGRAHLDSATRATWTGDYGLALSSLERAAAVLPVLRENTAYVAQMGLLQYRLGHRDTPEAQLYMAGQCERQSRCFEAESLCLRLLERERLSNAIRRECVRALLRRGIHDLNGNQTEHAIRLLERVVAEEPENLKANYALQLAYLRVGRHGELRELVDRMQWVYACFQVPTVRPVLATAHENLCLAHYREGEPLASYVSWQRTKKP